MRSGSGSRRERDLPPALASETVRRERLVATCRVVLALSSLLALGFDPSEPARFAPFAYALVAGYSAYSSVVAAWAWRARTVRPSLQAAFHAGDLVLFAAIVLVTAGGSSPFFVIFVFAVAAATVRWGAPGALWTTTAALLLFLGVALVAAHRFPGGEVESGRIVIRASYLAVIAFMIGYLGAAEGRLRARAAGLAQWPVTRRTELTALVSDLLDHAARVLGTPRVLLVWEDREEPSYQVAIRVDGRVSWHREPVEPGVSLTPPSLAGVPFLAIEGRMGGTGRILTPTGFRNEPAPLPGFLRAHLEHTAVLSVPFHGEGIAGRLMAFDRPEMTSDDLLTGQILAGQVALSFDQLTLFERSHEASLAEERIHLARELHDGVIQSLAAAALRLEALRAEIHRDEARTERTIDELQDLLLGEQRDLREILATLEPERSAGAGQRPALAERLAGLVDRMGRHWELDVELETRLDLGTLGSPLDHEVYSIVREALVNASRHGHASHARVVLDRDPPGIRLSVRDDGRGFPFHGRYDLPTLTAEKLGPLSLKARVAALGGALEIVSGPSGAALDIRLPDVHLPTADDG